ncbi:MAG: DUF559 domain-containing protein [Gammaproteobacteria bacterium]|nr:DUF559 domain-containing protein [Gammaproteobacteria bacterium]
MTKQAALNIRVRGHLLVPFGRPKWDISKIAISCVSTDSSYFTSDTPCAYIDVAANEPLRLYRADECLPDFSHSAIEFGEAEKQIFMVKNLLAASCEFGSDFEKRFLELYFKWVVESCTPAEWQRRVPREHLEKPVNDPWWGIEALLPLPQAHLYVHDPLSKAWHPVPTTMFKVDFAFWTGHRFVAVEVDGKTHIGDEKHITKDRMLQRAGVQVIHILNKELLEHGTKVMSALLPQQISQFWQSVSGKPNANPWLPF